MVQRHKITQFYTAPTAIRLLMRYGDEHPAKYDTSSLKVLGTVGEPINPEAWRWYYEVVGEKKCTVVDTYWQTETGGHVLTNLPGITPMKPGSCTMGGFGIDAVVLDSVTGKPATERDEHGNLKGVMAIRQPWPGMARTCLGDHERFLQTYLHVYPGYYFTGVSIPPALSVTNERYATPPALTHMCSSATHNRTRYSVIRTVTTLSLDVSTMS
jgi:acetyl-CoA synthetase